MAKNTLEADRCRFVKKGALLRAGSVRLFANEINYINRLSHLQRKTTHGHI
jgi:hypothetical protein